MGIGLKKNFKVFPVSDDREIKDKYNKVKKSKVTLKKIKCLPTRS